MTFCSDHRDNDVHKHNHDLFLKSEDWNNSLQNKNIEYSNLPMRTRKEQVAKSQQPGKVFSLRKHDNQYPDQKYLDQQYQDQRYTNQQYPDNQYPRSHRDRDTTPKAKHQVIFEEPEEHQ
jgi:hypothetical protein